MIKMHTKKTLLRTELTKQCSNNNCSNCNYKDFCFGCKEQCDAKFCHKLGKGLSCNMEDCGIPCKLGLPILLPNIKKNDFEECCNLSYNTIESKNIIKIDSNVWEVNSDYLIDIRLIMGKKGFTKNIDLKQRLKIPKSSKLYLSFCVPDNYLDLFESINDRWEILESFKFDGILAPNFSIYNNDPCCNRMLNEYRKRIEIKEACKLNINIYPELYLDSDHFLHYLNWITKTKTKIVYVSFQKSGYNTKSDKWKQEVELLNKAVNTLEGVKFLIIGAMGDNRYKTIQSIIPDAVFIDDIIYRVTACNRISRYEVHKGSHEENFKIAMKKYNTD